MTKWDLALGMDHDTLVQWSDVNSQILDSLVGNQIFKSSACEMMELEVPLMSQLDSQNAISQEILSLNKHRINEGVGRSRIHKGLQDHIQKGVRSQGKSE